MNKKDSIYFAGLMEDYLNIPSFLCEIIEKDLEQQKYKDVIEYIIQRKQELKSIGKDKDILIKEYVEQLKQQLEVSEQKRLEAIEFVRLCMENNSSIGCNMLIKDDIEGLLEILGEDNE